MLLRIIPPSVHFVQDSLIAAFLLLGPVFIPLGSMAMALSYAGGLSLLLYNGLTDRPGSLWPLFPEHVHMVLDYGGVGALLVLPWIIFAQGDRAYFFGVGIATLVLALLVDFTPDPRSARPFAPRLLRWLGVQMLAFGAVGGVLWTIRAISG